MKRIDEIFPESLLRELFKAYENDNNLPHEYLKGLCRDHIREINKMAGQQNDIGYLAYMLEYAMQGGKS